MASTMSVSGIVSGMDWESMIDELITKAAKPAQVQVSKKTNLQNKKSLFEEMKVMVQSIQSSLSPLKLPSTYKAKEVDIENISGSGSYKGILTASVNADAEVNVYDLKVHQLATAQTNRSKQINTSTIASALGDITGGTMYINMGGQKIGVEVSATDSLQTLKSKINTTIKTLDNPLNVTASVVDNKLILKSDTTGLGTASNSETVTYGYNGFNRLTTINVNDDDREAGNLVIRDSKSKQYTYGTDYVIANGTDIRWRQYNEDEQVKLEDSVKVKYAMAAGDVYTVTASVGKDAALSFDVVDAGTLASRLKIKDSEGRTYTYGEDFELVNGEISWIEEQSYTPETYEPDSYTVTYKSVDVSDSFTQSKDTADDPDYFTVSYTADDGTVYTYDPNDTASTPLEDLYAASGNDYSKLAVTDSDGTTYANGVDFTFSTNEDGIPYDVEWHIPLADDEIDTGSYYNIQSSYNEAYGRNEDADLPAVTFDVDGVSRTYINPKNPDDFTLTGSDGTEYVYGRDYVIRLNDDEDGYVISWALTGGNSEVNNIVSAYAQEMGIDSDGITRSPTDDYTFAFSKEGYDSGDVSVSKGNAKTLYELIGNSDVDADSSYLKITDANGDEIDSSLYSIDSNGNIVWARKTTALTEEPEGYSLSYEDDSGNKSSTENGATEEEVLRYAVDDYENLKITGSDGTEYIYGVDYTIEEDEDYNAYISWIIADTPQKPDDGTEYTLTYEGFGGANAAITDDNVVQISAESGGNISGGYLSYEQIQKELKVNGTAAINSYFALTGEDGKTYTYGTDYRITQGDEADGTSGEHSAVITWLKDSTKPDDLTSLTLTYAEGIETYNTTLTRSRTDELYPNSTEDYPLYADFSAGDSTITQGVKTFYEGTDYVIVKDENYSDRAAVKWLTDDEGGFEWFMPEPGASYTIHVNASDGTEKTYNSNRSSRDTLNMADEGFTTANGHISVRYDSPDRDVTYLYFDPEKTYTDTTTDEDGSTKTTTETGNQRLSYLHSFTVSRGTQGGVDTVFNFNWSVPRRTTNENMPEYGDEITVEYEYDSNLFTLSDNMDGELLAALELDKTDAEHYTAAQDARLELDGEIVTRSSNYIGESYGNELIKGMTIQLKGVGEVSLDVSHDAEKAVTSINTFMESYNDLMNWMNTRMTESQVDKDTAATIDSDDFRMRWGLLHGNGLLRNAKSQMRDILAQSFNFSFTKRSSAEEIYGTMAHNGLKGDSTLRLRIGTKYADITVSPTDTLQDIADRINDSENTAMRSMFYGDDGKLLGQPLLRASVDNDRLVISSTSDDSITMSGTAAMNALKMNYTYKGLFQIGLATTSTDYGKSGELEFDEGEFMEAMTDNPDEVQELMLMFASEMDSWVKSMLTTSASGQTSGTLTRQIEDIDTQIASIDEYLEKYQDRLDRQEEALRTRYANAENQFYKLSQQANSIAAILNQLNGYANSNSSDS